jgi:hypothetical protein
LADVRLFHVPVLLSGQGSLPAGGQFWGGRLALSRPDEGVAAVSDDACGTSVGLLRPCRFCGLDA